MRDIYASETGLLTALHTIQDECKHHVDCFNCPFCLGAVDEHPEIAKCGIRFCSPNVWKINDIMNWRAFK